ncbi:peptidase inhibitor family I36 protein [Amycolatopsis sp. NBC_01307]|uniref:peptidase inhibitor family I36 protein n=1 Tax=Amycolatopsis sp. NBC_01307 TaxID=2903561 RepID=UPI002E153310|nr:peptidase inhibitor family I36 protein [Amycolatopsis sp. NBC_01307]
MRVFKSVATVATSIALLTMVSVSEAGAQVAATCPAGTICLYTGENMTGRMATFTWGSPDLRGQGVDHAIWVVSSHPRGMCLYSGYNYTGASSGINETVTHGFRVSPVSSVKPCNG